MRIRGLVWLGACLLWMAAPGVGAQHAPVIHCGERTLDFGERGEHESFEHVFILENRGDLSLEIRNIHSTCGCAVAGVEPRTVPPGGRAELQLQVDLEGYAGRLEREVRVMTNDPAQPVYRLLLRGTVIPAREITPPHFIFSADGGQRTLFSEVVFHHRPQTISAVRSEQRFLRLQFDALEPGRRYRITAVLDPARLDGAAEGRVRVLGARNRELFTIPVWIQYEPPLRLAPDRITVDTTSRRAVTRHILVRPGSVNSFRILKVEVPDPAMQATVYDLGAGGYRVQVDHILPGTIAAGAVLIIHTDAAGAERLEVPFLPEQPEAPVVPRA